LLFFAFSSLSLFDECPETKVLFGFSIDIDTQCPELLKSKDFLKHASYMIQMLDSALHMLGPNIELLTDIMTDLGAKHVGYGVKPDFFIIMGDCLAYGCVGRTPTRREGVQQSPSNDKIGFHS
jgi:hypothetical protein